jgi:dTDP-4-dehydrorhamnose reductase
MKILLIGKTGQLGGDILLNGVGHEIFAPGRDALDVTSREAIELVIGNHRPEVVINTAAFHNVPLCETEYAVAFQVNCVAVRDLAAICARNNARFVTFSTDYVFGGDKRTPYTEEDRPAPLQLYGISKLAGEFASLSAAPHHSVIIRTCGLYGKSGARIKGGNFVDKRIEDAIRYTAIEMSCEQVVCPTYTGDLGKAVLQLIAHPKLKPGIYHLVNEGECSWYQFTKTIYEIMGVSIKVTPVDRRGMTGNTRRPLYSVLKNIKAGKIGIRLPYWREGLEKYLHGKYKVDSR